LQKGLFGDSSQNSSGLVRAFKASESPETGVATTKERRKATIAIERIEFLNCIFVEFRLRMFEMRVLEFDGDLSEDFRGGFI
jgi:hypothetical protein